MFSIRIDSLTKIYPDSFFNLFKGKVALDNVSLQVSHGERVGVIGRNGSGKSTLLSIIAGISRPSLGVVQVNGKVAAVLTLGVCLRDELTGTENIRIDGMVQGIPEEEMSRHILKIGEFSELGEALDRPVKTYSTGMKSRLAFSMITELEPEILLIDETLSAGDAFFAEKASARIKGLCAKGGIVILVSHSMDAIAKMCDRCLWLEAGKVAQDGPPNDVISSYLRFSKKRTDAKSPVTSRAQSGCIRGVYLIGAAGSANMFGVGEGFSIQLDHLDNMVESFEVLIYRADGLFLDKLAFSGRKKSGTLSVQLPTQPLAKGHYRIEVAALSGGRQIGYGITRLEIVDQHPPKGSAPLLRIPANASVSWREAEF